MKISNKRELQKNTINHPSDIGFKDFIMIYKTCTAEPYSFLVNDTTLPSDDPLRFRKNLLKWYTVNHDDQVRDEKLKDNIKREAAKKSALSSRKIDKYEYLTSDEILPSNQKQMIGKAKFTYSLLGKAFENQIKTTEDQEKDK